MSRRFPFVILWCVVAFCLLLGSSDAALAPQLLPPAAQQKPTKLWVFVGTYTDGGKSKGIYRLELDLAKGKLSPPVLAGESVNPSFLAIHPNQRFLYAVNEIGNFMGKKTGAVSAFKIDPKTADLTTLNQQSSEGSGPCHLVVDKQGKNVLAANYGGGSVCVLPIGENGRLIPATAFVQHTGKGVNKQRQEAPHAHSVNLDPGNAFALVADLGLDKVFVYRFDAAKGTLKPNQPSSVSVVPGAGPRHLAFHPDGRHAYVLNELNSTLTGFDWDGEAGVLTQRQTVSTLSKGFKGFNGPAEVVVHPSGKYAYASNRGLDSIAIFRVVPSNGELSIVGFQDMHIKTPRNFAIDPTGMYLLVANQDANNVVVFRINLKTGELIPTGSVAEIPRPVCLRMMPLPK